MSERGENYCRLFVGDRLYVVSEETLRARDDCFLAKLLNQHSGGHEHKQDIIYIDRDGKHFGSVLNHLRGCLQLKGWSERDLEDLLGEADFYSLEHLKEQIETELEDKYRCDADPVLQKIHGLFYIFTNDDCLIRSIRSRTRPVFVIHLEGSKPKKKLFPLMKKINRIFKNKIGKLFDFEWHLDLKDGFYDYYMLSIFQTDNGNLKTSITEDDDDVAIDQVVLSFKAEISLRMLTLYSESSI